MANITQEDIFGPDDSTSAPVPVPDSVAVDSSPSCSDDELEFKSCGKRAGKAPSRERLRNSKRFNISRKTEQFPELEDKFFFLVSTDKLFSWFRRIVRLLHFMRARA